MQTIGAIFGFMVFISLFFPSSRGCSSGAGDGCSCDDNFGSPWSCFDNDMDGFCDSDWDD